MKRGEQRPPPKLVDPDEVQDWQSVVGFPKYEINSNGIVRNASSKIVLRPCRLNGKYLMVSFHIGDQKKKSKLVHLLVADAFMPPKPSPLHEINHKNGRTDDPSASNLEWVTRSENHFHSYRVLGRKPRDPSLAAKGEQLSHSILTEALVREIRMKFAAGVPRRELYKQYPMVVPRTIREALPGGRNWRHVE